eukprot:m.108246 g.108246  ORF g.108246 m.108246 type:complete len:456 (+) comp12703_c5_seq1:37-1404(+)
MNELLVVGVCGFGRKVSKRAAISLSQQSQHFISSLTSLKAAVSVRRFAVTPPLTPPPPPPLPESASVGAQHDVHEIPEIAKSMFEVEWRRLEKNHGRHNMSFPREIIFLNGAPGSGKGTMARYLQETRQITHISTSDVLQSPEAVAMKTRGGLVDDGEVFYQLAKRLLNPDHSYGVVVDGFPRTRVQVECVRLLYEKMQSLHKEFHLTDLRSMFPRPKFHIVMLYIEEEESIRRQMLRGEKVRQYNELVRKSGEGEVEETRETDESENLARARYTIFRDEGYDPLRTLRSHFNYHFISADGTIDEVRARVEKEFYYQSSLELQDSTYNRLDSLPRAEDLTKLYRQNLVQHLDEYESQTPQLLQSVCDKLKQIVFPQLRLCLSSGRATIKTDDELFFEKPKALKMAVSVLAERGFEVSVRKEIEKDYREVEETTNKIRYYIKEFYIFDIRFPKGTV